MSKPRTKHERNAAKALARSRRNSPPPVKNTNPHKAQRAERLAGASPVGFTEEELTLKTVPELRTEALKRNITVTTKHRKGELIRKLLGR